MAHPIDVFIGRRVREERVRAGLTQSELAAKIGIRFQQLQKYETAANRVSGSRMWMIAQALDVPVETFFPDALEPRRVLDRLDIDRDVRLVRAIRRLEPRAKNAMANLLYSLSLKN